MSEHNEEQTSQTTEQKTTEQQTTSQTTEQQQTEQQKTEQQKQTAETLTAESITLPEGMTVDEAARDSFLEIMNDATLDPKGRAQKLIDLQANLMKSVSERGNAQWEELQNKWVEETQADPVVGGEKLDGALANIAKLIDKYSVNEKGEADPTIANEVRDMFDLTGAGNHRGMVRFLSAIAKELATEGGPVPGGSPTGGPRDLAAVLYPTMKEK